MLRRTEARKDAATRSGSAVSGRSVQQRRLLGGARAREPCAHLERSDARVASRPVDLGRKRIQAGVCDERRAQVGERERDPAPSANRSAYLYDRHSRDDAAGFVDEAEHERLECIRFSQEKGPGGVVKRERFRV